MGNADILKIRIFVTIFYTGGSLISCKSAQDDVHLKNICF